MTSDGTNSYAWDAENRLIKITYPGSGNYTVMAYDGLSRNVLIQEYVSSSVSSTKQFVWDDESREEARDSLGTITAQYFDSGEKISGTSYCFTVNHLGSVAEMTDSSGTVYAQLAYDPFGRVIPLLDTTLPDFQYGSYYAHARTGLNFAQHRAYSSSLGRWINRDPSEPEGENLFTYVENCPALWTDPVGDDKEHPNISGARRALRRVCKCAETAYKKQCKSDANKIALALTDFVTAVMGMLVGDAPSGGDSVHGYVCYQWANSIFGVINKTDQTSFTVGGVAAHTGSQMHSGINLTLKHPKCNCEPTTVGFDFGNGFPPIGQMTHMGGVTFPSSWQNLPDPTITPALGPGYIPGYPPR